MRPRADVRLMRALLLAAALLLAGCLTDPTQPTTPGSGSLVRPAHGEKETDGFFFEVDQSVSGIQVGQEVVFTLHEANRGADAEAFMDICGDGNPTAHLISPNDAAVAMRPEPQFRCMAAAGWGPQSAGGELWVNVTWNGTVYDGSGAHPAEPGKYTLRGTFLGRRGGEETTIDVDIPVFVIDPSIHP